MRPWGRFTAAGGLWLTPLGMLVGLTWLWYGGIYGQPSGETAGANAALVGAEISTVVVFGAALTGSRLRAAGWDRRPAARPYALIMAEQLWPHVLAGAVALLVVAGAASAYLGIGVVPDLRPVVVELVIVAAGACVGFAGGLWLRTPLAVVLAPACWWLLLAFRAAVEPLWWRHLWGTVDCCEIGETLNPVVLIASTLMGIGVIVAAYTIALQRRHIAGRAVRQNVALVLTVAALAGSAIYLVQPLGWSPAVARSGELTCAGSDPRFCSWPERPAQAARMEQLGAPVFAQIERDTGLAMPSLMTEDKSVKESQDTRIVTIPAGASETQVVEALVSAAVGHPTSECHADLHGLAAEQMALAEISFTLWWELWVRVDGSGQDATVARQEVLGRLAPDDPAHRRTSDLLALPEPDQYRWIADTRAAFLACDATLLPPQPGGEPQ